MKRLFRLQAVIAICLVMSAPVLAQDPSDTLAVQPADTLVTQPTDTLALQQPDILADSVSTAPVARQENPSLPKIDSCQGSPRAITIPMTAQNVSDVLSNQPGVVNADGRLHVRGGLADEVAYFIDGIPATDPYSGKLTIAVPPSALENAVLLSGGLPARYGGNMSGVVELTTIRPGRRIGVELRWTSDLLTGSRHDNRWNVSLSGPLPYVPKATFGATAQVHNGDDVRPCFMPDTFYVHDPAKDFFWGNPRRGWKYWDESYLPNSDFSNYYFMGSLGYSLPAWHGTVKLTGMLSREQHGEYDARWKYNLVNYGAELHRSSNASVLWQSTTSPQLHYTVRFSQINSRYLRGAKDTIAEKSRRWWQDYAFLPKANGTYSTDGIIDPFFYGNADNPYGFNSNQSIGFIDGNTYSDWHRAYTTSNEFQGDMDYRLGNNLFSAGLELTYSTANELHRILTPAPGWSGAYIWSPWLIFNNRHRTGSAYIQDEWTRQVLTIVPGLRFDLAAMDGASFASGLLTALSPHLTVAYHLPRGITLQASYENFHSLPSYKQIASGRLSSWRYDLSARYDSLLAFQSADQYQISVSHCFPAGLEATLAAYYKTTKAIDPHLQAHVFYHDRGIDPATGLPDTSPHYLYILQPTNSTKAHGLELSIAKPNGAVRGYLNYTFSNCIDKSRWSFDNHEYPLSYDLRHKLTAVLNFTPPGQWGLTTFNIRPFAGTTFGMTNNIGSGFPYSRIDNRGKIVGRYLSNRLPWFWTTDISMTREIRFSPFSCNIGLEITNLFNRKNLANVFPTTGNANDDGGLMTIDQIYPTNDSIAQYNHVVVTDSIGNTQDYYIQNPYFSKWADIDGNGYINRYERYTSYLRTWHDYTSDPFNSSREPSDRAFLQPRLVKLSFGIKF